MYKRLSLIIIILFHCSLQLQAQQDKDNYLSLSTGIDVRNAIIGSTATQDKPAVDLSLSFNMTSNNIDIGVNYEIFQRINFSKYAITLAYHLPLYGYVFDKAIKTTFIPGISPSMINRWGNWGGGLSYTQKSTHLSLGLDLGFRWDLNNNFAVEYAFNALPRTDLKSMYGNASSKYKASISGVPIISSNFIKLVYKFNHN